MEFAWQIIGRKGGMTVDVVSAASAEDAVQRFAEKRGAKNFKEWMTSIGQPTEYKEIDFKVIIG